MRLWVDMKVAMRYPIKTIVQLHAREASAAQQLRSNAFCLGKPVHNLIPQKLQRFGRAVSNLLLLTFLVILIGPLSAVAQKVVLDGTHVRVEANVVDGQLDERFLAKGESGWPEIAVSHGATRGATSILGAGGAVQKGFSSTLSKTSSSLVEEFKGEDYTLRRTTSLYGDGPWVKVTSQLVLLC